MADRFQELVEAAARDAGFRVEHWLPAGVLVSDASGAAQELHLVHLARRLKSLPDSEWEATTHDFLSVLLSARGELGPLESHAAELRPRLGPAYPPGGAAAPFAEPLPGTSLVRNLVVDAPRSMCYVTTADIDASGRPAGHWLERAARNLAAATAPDWLSPVQPDLPVLAGNAGDGYDAARALILDRLTTPTAAGHFVAVPARDWLFALAATPEALDQLGVLAAAAEATFKSDPYPIAPGVFWVRALEGWEPLDLAPADGGVRFDPPPHLLAAVGAGQ